MRREFFINILFLVAINLLIKPFYIFGIDRTVQNTVGAGDYGVYFALFNFTFLFQIINDFGIQNFNNRNIAQYSHLLDRYFPNILTLKLMLGGLYLLVVFAVASASGYEKAYFHLLSWLAINQILISLIFYFRSNISALAFYRTDSLVSVLDKLLMIIFCGILLWVAPFKTSFTIKWFVLAQTASLSLTAITGFIIVKGKLRRKQWSFEPGFLVSILKKSAPYALIIFLMTIYTRIDGVMLERMLPDGQTEAGIYAAAYRLLDASNMLGFLFASLLLPMFSRMIKNGDPFVPLLQFSFQLIWIASIGLMTGIFLFRNEIVALLYTEATPYWGDVLGYLMTSFGAVSGIYIFGTLLTANGVLMRMNAIFFVGVLLNLGLNFMWIPTQKAMGAVNATLMTQYFVMFALLLIARKEMRFGTNYMLIFRLLGFTICSIALGILLFKYLSLHWTVNFILVLLSTGLTGLGFKLTGIKQIRSFLFNTRS